MNTIERITCNWFGAYVIGMLFGALCACVSILILSLLLFPSVSFPNKVTSLTIDRDSNSVPILFRLEDREFYLIERKTNARP